MSDLLSKINANPDLEGVTSVLKTAGLCTDSEIRSLTREDLHELFPGLGKLKLRKTIFEIIKKTRSVQELTNELKAFIPQDLSRVGNGVLADYLVILKDMKTQLNEVQGFIDAHIDLLEGRNYDQLHQEHEKGPMQSTSASDTSGSVVNYNHQTSDYLRDAQAEAIANYSGASGGTKHNQGGRQESKPDRCCRGTSGADGHYQTGGPQQGPQRSCLPERKYQMKVTYQVVVSGKTLDADTQLMNKVVNDPALNHVQFVKTYEKNHQITILFCPISSRIGTDADAALSHVKDDKPVILVMMHHEREPKSKFLRISLDKWNQTVMPVNVFYHDSVKGLLPCEDNNTAASEIQNNLLKYSTPIDTSGNSQGAGVETSRSFLSKFTWR